MIGTRVFGIACGGREGACKFANSSVRVAKPTILVVDDDPAVLASTTRCLLLAGYDVLQAHDGMQALKLVQETNHSRISLVVTDIVMPHLRGDDLGRLLRHTNPALPVLYMSAFSAPTVDCVSEAEFEGRWSVKPFDFDELTARVQGLLEEARRLSAL
ncbi:MAG TPA: response regulator [Gemmatimonadales bacterium]|nr:response regulator [Gemmatimonadales bacterium]